MHAKSMARLFAGASAFALLAASATVLSPVAVAKEGAATKNVEWEDILNDQSTTEDVVHWGMGIRNHRYSSLKQINEDNVAGMKAVWSFSFGDEKQRGQETQALVHDGVIYVTGSYSRAFALDAKTGKKLWSYAHRLPEEIRPCCDVV
ncbi:MAG: PQQ-dependent dehydrogenase, methanol/ethanol family, partial [Pseudomonadota bacterium]